MTTLLTNLSETGYVQSRGALGIPFLMIGGMKMPQYHRHQYGRFQYGRYTLHGSHGLKVSQAIRLRVIKNPLAIQTMQTIYDGDKRKVRLRSNEGEWTYGLSATIPKETYKVRMRTNNGQWIESVRYTMKGE